MWGKYGETMSKYLTKGKQIAIAAELDQSTWQDSNGNNHSAVQLTVNELSLLASPRNESGGNGPPQTGRRTEPERDDIPF
jgi:single-strand DNA-binding protein